MLERLKSIWVHLRSIFQPHALEQPGQVLIECDWSSFSVRIICLTCVAIVRCVKRSALSKFAKRGISRIHDHEVVVIRRISEIFAPNCWSQDKLEEVIKFWLSTIVATSAKYGAFKPSPFCSAIDRVWHNLSIPSTNSLLGNLVCFEKFTLDVLSNDNFKSRKQNC